MKLTLCSVPVNMYKTSYSKSLPHISYYEDLSNHKAKKKVFPFLTYLSINNFLVLNHRFLIINNYFEI